MAKRGDEAVRRSVEAGGDPPDVQHTTAPIGVAGEPIRALTFAGGGFDTAMQLGVIHALLVRRAKTPDVVIGSSAGAVNAVALAEVLQAGPAISDRVERFRHLFEQYRNAPTELAHAFRPDVFQVDTQRPLEPLTVSTQHEKERAERDEAVRSRAGLINLYNTLLALELSVGTITRGIRRWLGFKAAADQRPTWRRIIAVAVEAFRGWMLIGQNIHRLGPVVPPALRALLKWTPSADNAATAGDLIFVSRVWQWIRCKGMRCVSLWLLATLWAFGGAVASLLITVAGLPLLSIAVLWHITTLELAVAALPAGMITCALALTVPHWRSTWTLFARAAAARRGVATIGVPWRVWSFGTTLRQTIWRCVREFSHSLWVQLLFTALLITWTVVLVTPVAILSGVVSAAYGTIPWKALADPATLVGPHVLADLKWWAAVVVIVAGIFGTAFVRGRRFGPSLLEQFDLDRSILSPYPVRDLLRRLFDPKYFGDLDIDAVVDDSLAGKNAARADPTSSKRLLDYPRTRKGTKPIHVLITVADLADNEFKVLPTNMTVVDGLTAALAAVPLLPPFRYRDATFGRHSFIDAKNVSNDPTRPLFSYLRHCGLVNRASRELHVYSVASLPLSRRELGVELAPGGRPREYTALLHVVSRARELRRFRDAQLDRRMTELHTRAMPPGLGIFVAAHIDSGARDKPAEQKELLRSWVYAIEPEQPVRANRRVMEEDPANRRAVIAETVADGCRTALQVMLRPAISAIGGAGNAPVVCRLAVQSSLRSGTAPLPGSSPDRTDPDGARTGPGLAEVCEHCQLNRPRSDMHSVGESPRRVLRVLDDTETEPDERQWPVDGWPQEDQPSQPRASELANAEQPSVAHPAVSAIGTRELRTEFGSWPRERTSPSDAAVTRPTVSLLFSGGVFRGVFQVGVLNALSEANVKPDIIAGASVGSITAAMVARAYIGAGAEATIHERQRQILKLASVYLSIDRLILTDRFADFVRGVTVRAAQAGFSIRDADSTFRRFDMDGSLRFGRVSRRVVAGLERLTYVSPFELIELLSAIRLRQTGKVVGLLKDDVQDWLDRVGVGGEILGAEPLAMLIEEYVLRSRLTPQSGARTRLSDFRPHGMYFLATATDLTAGRLRILGKPSRVPPTPSTPADDPDLLEALLASSAFPGVFRPRWMREVMPRTCETGQFIDGGVTDNLPLDAVAEFLDMASTAGVVARRPTHTVGESRHPVPHLLLCASLEIEVPQAEEQSTLRQLEQNWPAVLKVASRMGYNQKLALFARTQRNLRGIVRAHDGAVPWEPVDLEVVTVIPKWLCGTFGFHPMLGFRRAKQARSIAHGCAMTLYRLAQIKLETDGPARAAAWQLGGTLPNVVRLGEEPSGTLNNDETEKHGFCWYRAKTLCPFSMPGQEAAKSDLPHETAVALAEIHKVCRKPKTHRAEK